MTPLTSLRQLITQQHMDAALVSSVPHITYVAHYSNFSPLERDAYLLVTKNDAYLFTNPLYFHEVKTIATEYTVLEVTSSNPFAKQLAELLAKKTIQTLGVETDNLTVSEFGQLKRAAKISFKSINLRSMRSQKTTKEIALIYKACKLGDQAFTALQKKIHPGISEQELAFELELLTRKHGGQLSFPTIVCFGKNSAIPHHQPNSSKLKDGETILIDFGVRLNNYCSDMTRTLHLSKPTSQQKKVYETVLTAQQKAIDYMKTQLSAGERRILAKKVDAIARDYIVSQGYPSIPHSLGHGIGIEVHEAPAISPKSTDQVTDGMVFSIEPSVYLSDNFGVRIEDLFAIHDGHLFQLTNAAINLFS